MGTEWWIRGVRGDELKGRRVVKVDSEIVKKELG